MMSRSRTRIVNSCCWCLGVCLLGNGLDWPEFMGLCLLTYPMLPQWGVPDD